MIKLALMRISSFELTAPQVAAQINSSRSSSNRHNSTSTVQRRLRESGLHGRIAANKPLVKDTNNNKSLLGPRRAMNIINTWKSVLWSDESKFEIFGSNRRVFVRRGAGERMISACVVPTLKYGGGGVMCGAALLVTLSVIYLRHT
jgi:hypothetical protein